MEVSRLSQIGLQRRCFRRFGSSDRRNEDMLSWPILDGVWRNRARSRGVVVSPATIEDGLYSGSEEVVDLWRRLEAEALALELSAPSSY